MSKTTPKITPLKDTWRQLMLAARHRAPRLRASMIGLGLAAVLQGLALVCIIPLFRAIMHDGQWASVLPWAGLMTAFMIASTVVRWMAQNFDYAGDMVLNTHELRTELGQQLRRIPLEELQDKRSGEINATLLGNVDENLTYVLTIANLIANAVITPLTVAVVTLFIDWRIGLLLLLIFPVLLPFYRWRRPAFGRGMRALADANAQASAEMLEYTQGLAVLRAAGCAGEKSVRLQHSIDHLEKIQTIGQRKGAKPNLMIASVMELGLLLVVLIGAVLVFQGSLEVAVLAAVVVIIVRFSEPLSSVILMTLIIDLMEAALQKIHILLDIKPLPQQMPEEKPEVFDVSFDNVSFHYARAPEKEALKTMSAILSERSLTALVGPSGSGKTTITRLILRHADPQQGVVRIGGKDIRSIAPDVLNSLVSVVFQDVYLFDDTVMANIRMARPSATDAEVESAARAAHCHDFISRLPEGYQTRIGDLGGRLSGGERQRISIARAMLKDAPIVILDEPTAALDTESEVAVQAAIDALVRERTVIVIAHRLSTIAAADHILVIEDGQLAEQGTQPELLKSGGRFAKMWQTQQQTQSWHATN